MMTIVADSVAAVVSVGIFKDDGSGLKNAILPLLASLLVIIMGLRLLHAWGTESYGKAVAQVAGAIPVALFLFYPDQGIAVLKTLSQMLFGG